MTQKKKEAARQNMGSLLGVIGDMDLSAGAQGDAQALELKAEVERLRHELQSVNNGSIAPHNGKWYLGRFTLTRTGIIPPEDMNRDEADLLGYALNGLESAIQFWLGDWANWYLPKTTSDNERGNHYKQLAERFNMNPRTLKNYAYVARKIPMSLRNDVISFSHHYLIASQPDIEDLIKLAVEQNMTFRDLQDYLAMRQTQGQTELPEISVQLPPDSKKIWRLYDSSKSGDKKARAQLLQEIAAMRQWLDDIESELD